MYIKSLTNCTELEALDSTNIYQAVALFVGPSEIINVGV